jgi:signal transduction histidine kinase
MDNAIKFTPSAGCVAINARLDEGAGSNSKFVRVHITDTGPGIPDEHKQRLFDRYVQLKGQTGRQRGTGLGLTFCRLAIEAHGGRIWVEDNPGGGAIFAFTLPVLEDIRKSGSSPQ